VSLAIRPRHRAAEISTAARSITQRAPVTLTLVRHRAQPKAATIVRLTVTAVFAYLLALLLPNASRPVMAPLTALLVVQVSIYQTLRTAVRRVASVVAGVLLALGLSAWVGFTWWSLGIAIALGLTVGYALHLREEVLEVPISAMLIMSVGTRSAATGRIVETFIGTAAGLVAGFVLTSPRVQPAEEAIQELCDTMADLLDRMAAGLGGGPVRDSARDWLAQARSLGSEIRRVDDALRQAEESTKLNPRSVRLPHSTITLRESLEPWSTRRSRSASSPGRSWTAPGWPTRTTRWPIRTCAAGWPMCCGNCPPRSGRTGASRPSSTRPVTTCWSPSWSVTWPRRTMSRTGSASYWAPTRWPGRSGGRCGAS
jgi:Aromatic acid exporter family member 1